MRTRQERKHNTWKKILKKLDFIKFKNYSSKQDDEFLEQPHRLSKDRLQIKSVKTNNKTKRHVYGNYNKSRNWSASDQRKIDSGKFED